MGDLSLNKLYIVFLLVACSSKPQCNTNTVDAVTGQYARLTAELIDSGVCDKYTDILDCPTYRLIEEHQDLTLKGLGCL
jgi:hypothetical protein